MTTKWSEAYYMDLLIQIINRECNEALESPLKTGQPLPDGVRDNLKNMLAEASKASVALKGLRKLVKVTTGQELDKIATGRRET